MLFDAVSTSLLLLSLTGLSLASSTPPSRQHGLTARSARHADKHHPGGAGSLQRRAPTPMYMRPPDKPWAEHSWDEKLEVLRRETIANDPNRDPMRSSNARTVPHMQENLAANPAAQHALRIAKEHGVSSNELFQRTHERLQIWPHEHPPQPGKDDVAIEKLKEHDARHPYTKGYMPHVHEHFKNGWDVREEPPFPSLLLFF